MTSPRLKSLFYFSAMQCRPKGTYVVIITSFRVTLLVAGCVDRAFLFASSAVGASVIKTMSIMATMTTAIVLIGFGLSAPISQLLLSV
jgi:hypothetical protein